MSEPLLRLEGLTRRYRLPGKGTLLAVNAVSLTLAAGEVLGLVGESGSGKSTLGRMVMGLEEKSAGTAFLDGELLPNRYRRRDFQRYARRVQMIFQDPFGTLNPRLTIGESLAEPLQLQGWRGDRRARVAHWLERVGLAAAMADRYPHEFSGGQRQRIGIARALIGEPKLLICDEPTSALDVSVQAQVINLLAELRAEMGLAMLFIAHDLALVRHLADRVAVMKAGELVEVAPTGQLFEAPQHPFTRHLLAVRPLPDPAQRRLHTARTARVPDGG